MKPTPNPESSSIFNKIPKELFAASITGGLGLIGVIITVIVNHSGSTTPVKPVEASFSPTPIVTKYVVDAAPISTRESMPTLTASPSINGANLVRIEEDWGGCTNTYILPDSINPKTDKSKATREFHKLIGYDGNNPFFMPDSTQWTHFDNETNQQNFQVSLTGLGTNEEWISLDKMIVDSIKVSLVPNHLDIVELSGCGGIMEIRKFNNIPLKADFDSYTVKSTYPDDTISGFSIAPGETEQFLFPFECKQPGTYAVQFKLPCKYMGNSCSIEFAPPTSVVCPQTYTIWDDTAALMQNDRNGVLSFRGDYRWNGSGYSPSD
jgi:hypothetical protein